MALALTFFGSLQVRQGASRFRFRISQTPAKSGRSAWKRNSSWLRRMPSSGRDYLRSPERK